MVEEKSGVASTRFRDSPYRRIRKIFSTLVRAREVLVGWKGYTLNVATSAIHR
jgi:hypothetical protein